MTYLNFSCVCQMHHIPACNPGTINHTDGVFLAGGVNFVQNHNHLHRCTEYIEYIFSLFVSDSRSPAAVSVMNFEHHQYFWQVYLCHTEMKKASGLKATLMFVDLKY